MPSVAKWSWQENVGAFWWRAQLFLWTVVLGGVAINLASSWLTTKQWDMSGTPLWWLLAHPVVPVVGFILMVLQFFGAFWIMRHQRSLAPSSTILHLEQREHVILQTCYDIEQAEPSPQLPSIAAVVRVLQDRYAVQDIVDTLEWLEQEGDIQLVRAFAGPEPHHHHAEAWSFYLTPQGKRTRLLLSSI